MINETDLCLSIDLGTGGPKIGLVTFSGEVIDYEVHQVATHFAINGEATQDAGEWWTLILGAARRLLDRSDDRAPRVRAIAVTGQYASTVPVDANGLPTGRCITWLDTRGGRHSRRAVGGAFQGYNTLKVLQFIRKTGGAPSTSGADPVGQILHLMHDEPEVAATTRWFMEPVDYLTMRFTGIASATHASRLAMWMTDNRHLSEYRYDRQLLALVGIDEEKLPPLLAFGSTVGTITPDVATQLGLSNDTVVVTGMPDLHAAALGSGATNPFDTHVALSTTSWISCPVAKKKTDINHSIASVPGLTNDSYLIINNQETGAKSLEWLQGILAGSGPKMTFGEMTTLAATSPSGARGAIFTPWLAGERSPIDNKSLRGGFTNLSITTSTPDLIRAVMEGVAANSAWLFRYVEKFAGQSLTPLRLLGGGAQSDLWCQIYADALGREVVQVPQPLLTQLRGAAHLAAVALKQRQLHDPSALPRGRTFGPTPDASELMRAKAEQLPKLYERDRKWFRQRASRGVAT